MPLVISLYDGNRLSHSSLDGESGLFYQYISMIYVGNKLSHSLCDGEQGYLCFFLFFFYQYISVISLWFDLKIKSGCFRNRNLLEWQVLSLTTRHFDDNYCNSEKP